MKRKSTIATSTIEDRTALENRLNEYTTRAAKIQKLTAEMNIKIQQVRDQFEDRISAEDTAAKEIFDDVRLFFEVHQDEIPKGKKSAEYLSAIVGYRTSTPSVRLPRGVDEQELATILRTAGYENFTREVLEVDRRKILAASDDLKAEVAKKFSIKISQSERFFIEPKLEEGGRND